MARPGQRNLLNLSSRVGPSAFRTTPPPSIQSPRPEPCSANGQERSRGNTALTVEPRCASDSNPPSARRSPRSRRVSHANNHPNRAGHGLNTDNVPLHRFHQWLANLRVLEVTEIKTAPSVSLSHPFVERLIGTLRRECLDRTLFWTTTDLETKLLDFQHYYNEHRTHAGRQGHPPVTGVNADHSLANLSCYRWQKHCRGLYQTPVAV